MTHHRNGVDTEVGDSPRTGNEAPTAPWTRPWLPVELGFFALGGSLHPVVRSWDPRLPLETSMRRIPFSVPPLSALTLACALGAAACPASRQSEPKTCCDQPKIPGGVPSFKIVADEVSGPSDGQVVSLKAALNQPADRQQVYPVLHTLYAWAMTRGAFEPVEFRAEVFASEADAKANVKPLAIVERPRGRQGPTCDNAVPLTFPQAVERAFDASLNRAPVEDPQDTCHVETPKPAVRVDEGFAHQPKLTLDEASRSAVVEFPFLEDGKDSYAPTLSFNKAMTYWIEFTTSMFRRAPDLKTFAFVGLHQDTPVVRIQMSKNVFESQFASLQEEIAAHAAVTFQRLGMNTTTDKAAEKEQEAFKSKTFKEALKLLPPGQVQLAKSLKSS